MLFQMALSDPEVRGIYLFTDGKPDSSTSLVMKAVSDMNTVRQVAINTISFNCNDRWAVIIQHLKYSDRWVVIIQHLKYSAGYGIY